MFKKLAHILLLCLTAANLSFTGVAYAKALVYVIPVSGTIDMGLSPHVKRVIQEAEEKEAAAIILEINTFGGRVDAAVDIRDALLNTKIRTIAFINKRAISAGALLALACKTIAIAPGGSIGAATPVKISSSGETKATGEKMVSYMRKEFSATAERYKRPKNIVEAMVDRDVEIKGIIAKGKLLTMTQEEAVKWKVADFSCSSIDELLSISGLSGSKTVTVQINWAEKIARFVTRPMVSSLLVSIGTLGIMVELYTPGLGISGITGIVCLGSFFWGHHIVNLAGFEEIILFVFGIIMVILEVFVIPGFGIAGILGIICLSSSLILASIGGEITVPVLTHALYRFSLSLITTSILFIILLRFLPKKARPKIFVLQNVSHEEDKETPVAVGRCGSTLTTLRPAGKAVFGKGKWDVISDGEYIEKGSNIEVIESKKGKIVVRKC